MKYLSDEIYVDINLSIDCDNTYQTYEIWVTQDYTGATPVNIYKGRIYYNNSARLYLNDILESKFNNCDPFKKIYNEGVDSIGYINSNPNKEGNLFTVSIIFPNGIDVWGNSPAKFTYEQEIFNGYPILNNNTFKITNNLVSDDNVAIYVPHYMNNDIPPRYPNLPRAKNLFIGVDFYLTKGAQTGNIAIKNGTDGSTITDWDNVSFNNNTIFYKADRLKDKHNDSIIIEHTSASGHKFIRGLAKLDNCPADFYCIWVDRLGGTQCQPFEKRSVMKENIITSNITDYRERTRPYNKSVEYSWDLNTDWIDEKSYRTYESILVSPYIYLYDVQKDLGYWVICNQNSWTEKTVKNQKQLFNFNITLTANKNQKILF